MGVKSIDVDSKAKEVVLLLDGLSLNDAKKVLDVALIVVQHNSLVSLPKDAS